MFSFLLCNEHNQELHCDMDSWERQLGDQLWHVKETISKTLEVGAIG